LAAASRYSQPVLALSITTTLATTEEVAGMLNNVYRHLSLLCCSCFLAAFTPAGVSAADVKEALENCYACHGEDGASSEKDIPIIGGLSAQYILDSMAAYRNKERPCEKTEIRSGPRKGEKEDMCEIAGDLSEAEVTQIAEHLASEPFVRARQEFDPQKAERGKAMHNVNCRKCHEDGGSSPDDDAGILAGQWMPYMKAQMEDYVSGERPMPEKMIPKMEKLDESDIENLLHYYASFQ
jgi:sulfide dehydrogenase cytochrome subunit